MRWWAFGIVALGALVLQVGTSRVFGLGPQRIMPDLLLLAAVTVAFRGERHTAPVACWVLGLLKDLTSPAPLGAYALGIGLLGWGIVHLREWLYGARLLPQVAVLLAGGALVEHFVWGVCRAKGAPLDGDYGSLAATMALSGLFTAALYPYGQWLLGKLERPLGLERRRGYRASRGG